MLTPLLTARLSSRPQSTVTPLKHYRYLTPVTPPDRVTFSAATKTQTRPALWVIANRDPFFLEYDQDGQVVRKDRTGGLATGMLGALGKGDAWFYTEKNDVPIPAHEYETKAEQAGLTLPEFKLYGVRISPYHWQRFYSMSNKIWPVVHEIDPSLDRYNDDLLQDYIDVNQQIANETVHRAVAQNFEGDFWIQDYHFMMLPEMLREGLKANGKTNAIGYFYHITFPDYDFLKSQIPDKQQRRDIFGGILGADLAGFHDVRWRYNYLQAIQQDFGNEVELFFTNEQGQRQPLNMTSNVDLIYAELQSLQEDTYPNYKALFDPEQRIEVHFPAQNRSAYVGIFPIGHSNETYLKLRENPKIQADAATIRDFYHNKGMQLIVSSGRMDYTKGILERLEAIDQFLTDHPEYLGKVKFLMWEGQARDGIQAYEDYAFSVQLKIQELNQKWARLRFRDELVELTPTSFLSRYLNSYEVQRFSQPTDADVKALEKECPLLGQTELLEKHKIWTPIEHRAFAYNAANMTPLNRAADVVLTGPWMDGFNLIPSESALVQKIDDPRWTPALQMVSKQAGCSSVFKKNALLFDPRDKDDYVEKLFDALTMNSFSRWKNALGVYYFAKMKDINAWRDRFVGQQQEVKQLIAA